MRRGIGAFLVAGAMAGSAQAAPTQWSGNGHFYELITSTESWFGADTAAQGMSHLGESGYLATVTSADEWTFLDTVINPGSVTAWLGGSDAASEGIWEWVTGPEAGTTFWTEAGGTVPGLFADWNSGEPNDLRGEDFLHGWFASAPGTWNDAPGTQSYAYVVEYSAPAVIPVPPAFVMLAGALAMLNAFRTTPAQTAPHRPRR